MCMNFEIPFPGIKYKFSVVKDLQAQALQNLKCKTIKYQI